MTTKTATKKKQKTKVLLVDDSEIVRMYIKDIFWLHGLENKFELTITAGINEAEKVIMNPKKKPSLVLLDLSMPMIDGNKSTRTDETGFELLKKIKGNPKLKNTVVIIFSGFTESKYRKKAKELGADEYLVKDDHLPQDMVAVIERFA